MTHTARGPADGGETPRRDGPPLLQRVRVRGGIDVRFAQRKGRTIASDFRERDGYKLRIPKRADITEAAIINTGGGVAGGDVVECCVEVQQDASAVVSMPAAEKIYGSFDAAETRVDLHLTLGERARLDWLPQETILFDQARLKRSISTDMTNDARLLIAETVIFGRTARGEVLRNGLFADQWRIRRDGRIVFAENTRCDGDVAALMAHPGVASGGRVISTLVLVHTGAADRIARVRTHLADAAHATANPTHVGASTWNDLLVVRMVGDTGAQVRELVEVAVPLMADGPVPRVWAN